MVLRSWTARRLRCRASSRREPTLAALKARAAAEGLPYQVLAASLIHRYVFPEPAVSARAPMKAGGAMTPRRIPVQIVLVELAGDIAGVYASEPAELLYVDFAGPVDAPSGGAIFTALHAESLADMPAEVVETFCLQPGDHAHRGDVCPLGVPKAEAEED